MFNIGKQPLTAEERRKKAEEEAAKARAMNPRKEPSTELYQPGPVEQQVLKMGMDQVQKAMNPGPRRTLQDRDGYQRYQDDGSRVFPDKSGALSKDVPTNALNKVNPDFEINEQQMSSLEDILKPSNMQDMTPGQYAKSSVASVGDAGVASARLNAQNPGGEGLSFGSSATKTKDLKPYATTTAELHKKTNEDMQKDSGGGGEGGGSGGQQQQREQHNEAEKGKKIEQPKTEAVNTSNIGGMGPLGSTGSDIFASPQITPDRLAGPITEAGTAQLEALGMNPGNLSGSALQAEMGQVLAKDGLLAASPGITGVATQAGALAAPAAITAVAPAAGALSAIAPAMSIAPALATIAPAMSIAPALAGAAKMSDERLKEDITKIGKLESGLNLYRWSWNDKAKAMGINAENNMTVGVIAQEALEVIPEAVMKYDDGYYRVDYSKVLGL